MDNFFDFEWDPIKAAINFHKHGIAFEMARRAFDDPFQYRFDDFAHSTSQEKREVLVGFGDNSDLLAIVFTYREGRFRLISARKAHKKERRKYYEAKKA